MLCDLGNVYVYVLAIILYGFLFFAVFYLFCVFLFALCPASAVGPCSVTTL